MKLGKTGPVVHGRTQAMSKTRWLGQGFGWVVDCGLFGDAASAKDAPRSFSLSTSRTFAPGESVKIQLFARNEPALEFRVYKVKDEEKFFAGLKSLHSFGESSVGAEEKIDEETWLERLHDYKAHLWYLVRHFFRGQFNDDARDTIREGQGKLGKRSTVVGGVSEFAQVPLLNESQLVARWKLVTPPVLVSETQQLPVDGLKTGVYLIEATDGTYKAYTVAIVTSIAMVERVIGAETHLYVGDRKTGAPVEGAEVALWSDENRQAKETTGADGMAVLKQTAAKPGAQPENVFVLAKHGGESALVAPYSYMFEGEGAEGSKELTSYVYTDRPVYRPGHTVHIKGVLRKKKGDELDLPDVSTLHLRVTDADNKPVLDKDVPVSGHGTVTADLTLASDAGLGYYTVSLLKDGQEISDGGDFYVEEYKKPEYQVTVKPVVQRVLQGNSLQAVIEAKYFFGEPVANAKVKYVVATTTHYWWGEGDDDDQDSDQAGNGEGDDNADAPDNQDYEYSEQEQQEQSGCWTRTGD